MIKLVDTPLIWPAGAEHGCDKHDGNPKTHRLRVNPGRAFDKDILTEFYRGVRPFSSEKLGMYWRGPLELLDGSSVEVVLIEDSAAANTTYSMTMRSAPAALKSIADELATVEFPSARAALITAERSCNRELYRQQREPHKANFSA